MDHDPDIAAFEAKIIEDAGKESASILDQARQRREDKLAVARREADREREEAVSQARAQAERDRKRRLAEAAGEARNILMLAREQAVDGVFAQVRERAAALRNEPEYRADLASLVVEAVRAVDRPEMEVVLSPRDAQAFGPEIAGRAERARDGNPPLPSRVAVSGGGADEAGALVRAEGGRVVFDNTLSARLRRLAPSLRRMAYRELFGGAEENKTTST